MIERTFDNRSELSLVTNMGFFSLWKLSFENSFHKRAQVVISNKVDAIEKSTLENRSELLSTAEMYGDKW